MAGSMSTVNILCCNDFTELFHNIVEHCRFIAAAVYSFAPYKDFRSLSQCFDYVIDQLAIEVQIGVIRCLPDLAGRLAEQGRLSAESKMEQQSAGLECLAPSEREWLREHNTRYKSKFGFPFVICARQNKKAAIMEMMGKRLPNSFETEVETAITEVKKIAHLRLCNIMQPNPLSKL